MGRAQSGIERKGKPPAARSVLARKPFTAPSRLPLSVRGRVSSFDPSASSISAPRSLRRISH